jgi:immune inhibitor A
LAHSQDTDALMYPYYSGAHRFLDQDDIDGIQSIYGSAGWVSKVVQRVFVSHHSQNCWAFLQDIGWRKVETDSADGVTNMFVSLCAARVQGIAVTAYVEDGTIRIIYI